MVREGRMTLVEARNAAIDLEIEEMWQTDVILGLVQVYPRNIDWDLIPNEEEGDIPLAEQMRLWEQEERDKMELEHGRSFGSSHSGVGGGAALSLDDWLLDLKTRFEGVLGRYLKGMERGMSVRGNSLTQEA
jgi:hypothetical protein